MWNVWVTNSFTLDISSVTSLFELFISCLMCSSIAVWSFPDDSGLRWVAAATLGYPWPQLRRQFNIVNIMSAVDSEAFLCFTLHQKNISPEHEQHKTIIMSKVTTCRFRFKFSSCEEICRHLAFVVLPVIIELANNSQKSLMRWRGQLVIIAISRKYISYPFMNPKSTSLLRLVS